MDISRRRLVQATGTSGAVGALGASSQAGCDHYWYRFVFPWKCTAGRPGFGKSALGVAAFGNPV